MSRKSLPGRLFANRALVTWLGAREGSKRLRMGILRRKANPRGIDILDG